ncbi:UPF0149 family protein [Novosphingobium sp. AP12]|uniref:UPF0149 family protein n=1 Tax=Novosphingobium sp. AP12 TaxID=1144305 RepID=UPI000271F66B|nr:UPF0149 family protein [Novosphingobium sp. AP12]EJL24242.1 hypothetical protein family (UPF0149) [Novosphingobium sp. AP12]
MSWISYQEWQREDPQNRPGISLADGYLAGAAVSLQVRTDDVWIAEILGVEVTNDGAPDELAGPRRELMSRLAEARSSLTTGQNTYVPTLDASADGEFDLSGWASGFLEATGSDLDMWLYHLAGSPECTLLGLLGTHAVGPMGDAGKAHIAAHEKRQDLEMLQARSWEFVPGLLQVLYDRKVELGDLGA